MHVLILMLAWFTPAAIAGMLGWSGIWGAGSAFGEYLIPLPVAGGVFHVPSFAIAAWVIIMSRRADIPAFRYLPVIAFSVLAAALALMLEFDRLNAWLFTDYEPAGSPLRLDGNPFLLFVATDAFWVGAWASMRGYSSPARSWLALPLLPLAVVAISIYNYQSSGPVFEIGRPMYTGVRGNELIPVYTSSGYDEAAFRQWVEQEPYTVQPWHSVNSEHAAVLFTNSMQAIKWGQLEDPENNTVATLCLYEEDQSIHVHRGYFDCFAERNTVQEELAQLTEQAGTGLGRDIDQWFARVLLCEDVDLPESGATYIALIEVCEGMHRVYPRNHEQFVRKYGEDSEQVAFVRAEAARRGLSAE